ncbi:MAG TPA: biopolymer transporter ExbD [Planctomycetaceae bacterium]|nr:biopolymer transporter ExbD [Planctomycetaceae bacterium]
MKRRATSFGSDDDAPAIGGPKRKSEADLDITPMIDVTFLLLIFFMVTSTMQQSQENLPVAEHGVGVQSRETFVVSILAPRSLGSPPTVRVAGGEELSGTGGPTDLDEGRHERIRELVGGARQEGKSRVIIRADRDVPYGFIDKVMRAVSEVEGMAFSFEVKDRRK